MYLAPKVSILLPTYNRANYLKETILSILNQGIDNFELIICDNASTDDTSLIVSDFLFDSRVKYIKNEVNLGPILNHNIALESAKGEYICPFSDDDIMVPLTLKEKIDILDSNANIALVHTNLHTVNKNGEHQTSEHWAKEVFEKNSIKPGVLSGSLASKVLLSKQNFVSMTSVVFRKSIIDANRLRFNNQLKYLIDWDLWLNLSRYGDFFFSPTYSVKLRRHETNESSFLDTKIIEDELLLMYLGYFHRSGESFKSTIKKYSKENQILIKESKKNIIMSILSNKQNLYRLA